MTPANHRVTPDQRRAHQAYLRIEAHRQQPWGEDYGRLCLRLPLLLLQNGLCQALAFLESKAKPEKPYYDALLTDLSALTGSQNLATMARTAPRSEYLRLTRETIWCSQYLKRYAEAILKLDPTVDGDRL